MDGTPRACDRTSSLSSGRKALVVMAGLAALAALVGGAVFIVYSLGFSGRTADLRTFIYETAIQMFIEKPIVGYGVFTFGAGLARLTRRRPLPRTATRTICRCILARN